MFGENVRFEGRHLARWVHENYGDVGCALAIELKKVFMDEWTGELDLERMSQLGDALIASGPAVRKAWSAGMSVGEIDLAIDRRLSEICGLLPMLQLLTPINVPEQRRAFLEGDLEEPEFSYRDLPDLDGLADELAAINPEEATDPVLIHMIRGMHRELERRLELLATRNTDQFLLAAIEQYGHVETPLLELAHRVLERSRRARAPTSTSTPTNWRGGPTSSSITIAEIFPELSTLVHVSEAVAGVMVENGDLFIGIDTSIAGDRVEQLLHHEIGVHVVTYVNGSAQPIRMLSLGLSGYEETQEALGVLAEHLGGGLRPKRLRAFALRVVAADSVSGRATFRETYDRLTDLGAGRNRAFTTAMRAHRSGGMTKDALYLGGLTGSSPTSRRVAGSIRSWSARYPWPTSRWSPISWKGVSWSTRRSGPDSWNRETRSIDWPGSSRAPGSWSWEVLPREGRDGRQRRDHGAAGVQHHPARIGCPEAGPRGVADGGRRPGAHLNGGRDGPSA